MMHNPQLDSVTPAVTEAYLPTNREQQPASEDATDVGWCERRDLSAAVLCYLMPVSLLPLLVVSVCLSVCAYMPLLYICVCLCLTARLSISVSVFSLVCLLLRMSFFISFCLCAAICVCGCMSAVQACMCLSISVWVSLVLGLSAFSYLDLCLDLSFFIPFSNSYISYL